MGTAGLIITSSFRLPIKAKVFFWGVLTPPRRYAFLMLRLRQFPRMASCVPAVCKQNDGWHGERSISHTEALCSLSHLEPQSCKIRRVAKTIVWSPVAHTLSPWSLGSSSHTSVQRAGGPALFSRCHCSSHVEQNVPLEHGVTWSIAHLWVSHPIAQRPDASCPA